MAINWQIKMGADLSGFNAAMKEAKSQTSAVYGSLQSLKQASNVGLKVTGREMLSAATANAEGLNRQLQLLQQKQNNQIAAGLDQGSAAAIRLQNEIQRTTNKIQLAENEVQKIKFPPGIGDALSSGVEKVGSVAKTATLAVGGIFASGVQPALEYERGIANLGTVAQNAFGITRQENEKLGKELTLIGTAQGIKPAETLNAAYEAVSAGLFKTTEEAKKGRPALSALAKVGNGTLTDAVNASATAQNAFSLSTEQTQAAQEGMYKSIQLGRIKLSEYNQSLGQAAPSISAAGGSINDFSASMIVMTGKGIAAAEAGGKLKQMFNELANPADKLKPALDAAGISLKDFEAKGGTLPQYLQLIQEKTGKSTDELKKLFQSQEAGDAFFSLMSDKGQALTKDFNEVANAGGSIAKQMKDTSTNASFGWDQLVSIFDQLRIAAGEKLAGALGPALKLFKTDDPQKLGQQINGFIDTAINIGKVTATIWAVKKAIDAAKWAMEAWKTATIIATAISSGAIWAWQVAVNTATAIAKGAVAAFNFLMEFGTAAASYAAEFAMWAWSGVVSGATAIASGAVTAWNMLMEFGTAAAMVISEAAMWAWSGVVGAASLVAEGAIWAFNGAMEAAAAMGPILGAAMDLAFGPIGIIVAGVTAAIAGAIWAWNTNFFGFRDNVIKIWDGIKYAFEVTANWLGKLFQDPIGAIGDLFNGLGNIARNAGNAIWSGISWVGDAISDMFSNIWNGITDVFSDLGGALSNAVGWAIRQIPGIGGAIADGLGLGGKATGGYVNQSGLYNVNERGQEMLQRGSQVMPLLGNQALLQEGDKIINATQTQARYGQKEAASVNNITLNFNIPQGMDAQAIAREVTNQLKRVNLQ